MCSDWGCWLSVCLLGGPAKIFYGTYISDNILFLEMGYPGLRRIGESAQEVQAKKHISHMICISLFDYCHSRRTGLQTERGVTVLFVLSENSQPMFQGVSYWKKTLLPLKPFAFQQRFYSTPGILLLSTKIARNLFYSQHNGKACKSQVGSFVSILFLARICFLRQAKYQQKAL